MLEVKITIGKSRAQQLNVTLHLLPAGSRSGFNFSVYINVASTHRGQRGSSVTSSAVRGEQVPGAEVLHVGLGLLQELGKAPTYPGGFFPPIFFCYCTPGPCCVSIAPLTVRCNLRGPRSCTPHGSRCRSCGFSMILWPNSVWAALLLQPTVVTTPCPHKVILAMFPFLWVIRVPGERRWNRSTGWF